MESVSYDSYCTQCRHHYHSSRYSEHSGHPTFVVDETEEEALKRVMKNVEVIPKNLL